MTEDSKEKKPSKGLGDTIAKITHAVGIDKVVDGVADLLGVEDCGCSKRQELLNKLVPYKTPDPITTPIDPSLYDYEGKKTFKALYQITLSTKGKQVIYPKDSIIRVNSLDGMLYPFLKHLLETSKIELYK